jgi:uncharacterized protein (TIGR04255 family)
MFGFPKVERVANFKFKTNILNQVLVQFNFLGYNPSIHGKALVSFLSSEFPITKSSQHPQTGNSIGIAFSSDTLGSKVIEVTNSGIISYFVNGKNYKNFEDTLLSLAPLFNFFNSIDTPSISRVGIRKINVLNFNKGDLAGTLLEASKKILNDSLASSLLSYPSSEGLDRRISETKFVEGASSLVAKCGFIKVQGDDNSGQILLDIDMYFESIIDVHDLENKLKSMNEDIFDVFDWSISDETKKVLNG